MDEIVDMCVGSFHLMARDPNNRALLKQLNSIPLFIQVRRPAPLIDCSIL